jgi:hypothetical protein
MQGAEIHAQACSTSLQLFACVVHLRGSSMEMDNLKIVMTAMPGPALEKENFA